jgi:hypothetical protein
LALSVNHGWDSVCNLSTVFQNNAWIISLRNRKDKGQKEIQIGEEEIKLLFFADMVK